MDRYKQTTRPSLLALLEAQMFLAISVIFSSIQQIQSAENLRAQ